MSAARTLGFARCVLVSLTGVGLWWMVGCTPQRATETVSATAQAPVTAPALDPNSPLAQARALKQQGKLDEARELLARAAPSALDDINLQREYQDLLRVTRRVEEGRTFYLQQRDARPTSGLAWYLYGRSVIIEAPSEAETAFRKALELDPRLEWAWLGLGTVQSLRGDGFSAVQVYEKALEQFPNSANLYFNLADARKTIGALRTALEAGEEAVKLDPTLAKAWELMGVIQQQQGDESTSRKSLERALSLDSNLPIAHLALAELLVTAGDIPAARTHAEAGVAMGKSLPDALKQPFPDLAARAPAKAPAPAPSASVPVAPIGNQPPNQPAPAPATPTQPAPAPDVKPSSP